MFRSLFASLSVSGSGPAADDEDAGNPSKDEVASKGDAAAGTEKNKAVANQIQKMDSIIRRKLHGTGAQYNMKVVVRGERRVGKSTLLRRLQGLPYEEKYTPTPEIQTTTINNWGYRNNQDVVKIEVWDVVDKGLARGGVARLPDGEDLENAVAGLPTEAGSARGGRALAVLDASVVNVYQGANAVIFMVDPYRPETLDKVEAALAEAPVNIPAVVLLNFRDKLEEDSAAKANEKPENPAKRPAQETPPSDPPEQKGEKSGAAGEVSEEGDPTEVKAEDEAGEGDAGEKAEVEGAKAGAWGHVVTLESARLMMDRVREVDVAEERGPGRRISLFDCSMKNCFGLRVLYTYLNVPFLELKRQSLLQQARITEETLEREHRELEGFIFGHSYANYMQHLLSSDVDPTAGRSVPANPPGRPMISSLPPPSSSGHLSLERRGSTDSHSRKEKKKKRRKDKDNDKPANRKHHRQKGGKGGKDDREAEAEAAPEYEGKVIDAKEFTPVTKKTATEELNDFFGASSEGDSDKGIRDRNKVVKAIKPGALNTASTYNRGTDSDEMPAPATSRLKRVMAPVKMPIPGYQAGANLTWTNKAKSKDERNRDGSEPAEIAEIAASAAAASPYIPTPLEREPLGAEASVQETGKGRGEKEDEKEGYNGEEETTFADVHDVVQQDVESGYDGGQPFKEKATIVPPSPGTPAADLAQGDAAPEGVRESDTKDDDLGSRGSGTDEEQTADTEERDADRNGKDIGLSTEEGVVGENETEVDAAPKPKLDEASAGVEDASYEEVVPEETESSPAPEASACPAGTAVALIGEAATTLEKDQPNGASGRSTVVIDDRTEDGDRAAKGGGTADAAAEEGTGKGTAAIAYERAGADVRDAPTVGDGEGKALEAVEVDGIDEAQVTAPGYEAGDSITALDDGTARGGEYEGQYGGSGIEDGIAEDFFGEGSVNEEDDEPYRGVDGDRTAGNLAELDDLDGGEDGYEGNNPASNNRDEEHQPSPRLIASSVVQHEKRAGFGYSQPTDPTQKGGRNSGGEGLSEAAREAIAAALANTSLAATTTKSRSSSRRENDGGKSRKKSRRKEKREESGGEEDSREGSAKGGDNELRTTGRSGKDRKDRRSGRRDGSSSKRHHLKSTG